MKGKTNTNPECKMVQTSNKAPQDRKKVRNIELYN